MMLLSSAVAGVCDPLQSSIIPLFADDDHFSLALRTKSMLSSIPILLGPILGRLANHLPRNLCVAAGFALLGSSFAMNGLIAQLGIALSITSLGAMMTGLSLRVFLIPDLRTFMRAPDTQLNDAYLANYPSAFAR
ncbi:hypothetical protein [Pseudomonas marginalis]|uniref:hypothetical protein n=1 Tax=Pseudomonas marginalis TaxID=298 RepID=UPI002A3725CE|nr:hypothetical protein [Pseudomonas marginalis]WPN23596.1 hypothetical protein QMK57_30165 [Pseudomonas marginalis]